MLDAIFARIPTVRARLNTLAAILCLMMAVLTGAGFKALADSSEVLRVVYEDRVVPLQQLKAVSDSFAVNIVDATHKVRNQNIDWAQGLSQVQASTAVIERQWKDYTATHLVPEEKALVEQVAPLLAQAGQFSQRLQGVLQSKDEAALAAIVRGELYQTIDPVTEKIDQLVHIQLKVARQAYEASAARNRFLKWGGVAALLLGCLVGWLIAGLINGRIMRSLGTEPSGVRGVVEALAKGRLRVDCPVAPGDRSSVIAYVGAMQQALIGTVGTIQRNAQELDVAASQIAQGNMDLSVRTEQAAASMQSAGANVDDVIERLRLRVASSGEARELTQEAVQVAEQAGGQMARVTSAMQGINDASRRIGDILGVIDSIAFQTNILALNAAVEAARAGEQGRGFAVVAAEVRTLAQRSAEAAKEIKTLISEASERTRTGVNQVDTAGQTLQSMVDGVQRLNALTSQLDVDAAQDEADLEQLQRQIHELDKLAQQNAALVEEMAAASEGLKEQAKGLSSAVAVFQL